MNLENTTIEKPQTEEGVISSQELIMGPSDIEEVDKIIDDLEHGRVEHNMGNVEFKMKQFEEAQRDPNRHLTVLKFERDKIKKEEDITPEDFFEHFTLEEDKHGFSLASRFSLRNIQYLEEINGKKNNTPYLIEKYKHLKEIILEAITDVEQKNKQEN